MSTMDQVIEVLESRGRQTARQIADLLDDHRGNVWASLCRLMDKGLVEQDRTQRDIYWVLAHRRYFAEQATYPRWLEQRP